LIAGPLQAAELSAQISDQKGEPVADVVVLATPDDASLMAHAKPPSDAVDQVKKQFVPYVKAVYAGAMVSFPNRDNIHHQVYSFSPAKKFELPLYAGAAAPPVLFDTPGIVVLGCNIHDWMIGYIYVSDTPFFGTTEYAGTTTLSGLPPGRYTVRIWHPSMESSVDSTARTVTVSGNASSRLEWRLTLKPTYRVRRVSDADNPAYR
jgi:plastocyanin